MPENTEPQMPTPAPELKKLDFLVGTWRMDGRTEDTPMGPGADMTSTETFEWMEGGFFLVHRWEGGFEVGGQKIVDSGYEFFDYDAEKGQYRSHYFNSFGAWDDADSTYVGDFAGDSLVMTGPARMTRTLNADGTITCDSDMPDGEGGFIPSMRATLTKTK
ncbi:DUF1579 family protein [Streptomyces sp. NBC_01304]|uniref:DUF1579 family protein n=1 Tax=Streptomyces sp. NBC_01304 TaxID=2903818 RepID=UPI002E12089E|nr:DUF1579 domain-containing protein [Streptomyces sp. NBC_01304]